MVRETAVLDHTAAVPYNVLVEGAALADTVPAGVVNDLSSSSCTGLAAVH